MDDYLTLLKSKRMAIMLVVLFSGLVVLLVALAFVVFGRLFVIGYFLQVVLSYAAEKLELYRKFKEWKSWTLFSVTLSVGSFIFDVSAQSIFVLHGIIAVLEVMYQNVGLPALCLIQLYNLPDLSVEGEWRFHSGKLPKRFSKNLTPEGVTKKRNTLKIKIKDE